jgi:glucuronoarabinoxylan endo-1,4-beta-xylanase
MHTHRRYFYEIIGLKAFVLTMILCSSTFEINAQDGTVAIQMDSTAQSIRGFGAANIVGWRPDMTEQDVENAYGLEDGQLGLSVLRLRIPPNEDQWSSNLATAKLAYDMGALVYASPWSPPAYMKTNNNLVGGRLAEEFYGDYAAYLNRFAEFMEENGVPLYAISLQNEPDIEVSYESCDWSPEEMVNFLRNHADSISTRIIAPESFQFRRAMSDPILNDSLAAANLDILGGHIYGGGLAPFPLAEELGKEIWMTEYLMNMGATSEWASINDEEIWNETMEMVSTIQQAMKYNWNMYTWWYLKRYYSFIGEGDQGTENGEILKRGYAFSQFSKFVRPGFIRVNTDGPYGRGFFGVSITAYKDSSNMVIIAANDESSDKEIEFSVEDGTPDLFKQYRTSLTQNVNQLEVIEVQNRRFTTTLPAKSVTTFVSEYLPVSTEEINSAVPSDFYLDQNYPNPFNPTTVISYQVPVSSRVSLKVYDLLGREVSTLVDERISAGIHQIRFDASGFSSGVYIYRLQADNFNQTQKMLLIK